MIGQYIEFRQIFPDEKPTFEYFTQVLSSLSKTDTVLWCARLINMVCSAPENDNELVQRSGLPERIAKVDRVDIPHIVRQGGAVRIFFGTEEGERLLKALNEHEDPDRSVVFFRGQLLELIRWVVRVCVDKENDGTSYEDPEVRRSFLRVALMASTLWAKRVFGARLSVDRGREQGRRDALGAFYKGYSGAHSSSSGSSREFVNRTW
jgi:hypothetical protein